MISRRELVRQGIGTVTGFLMVRNSLFATSMLGFSIKMRNKFSFEVVTEEDIYTYQSAKNGSGPMWAHGATTIVRWGSKVFASGLETDMNVEGLSRCRWLLFERESTGWLLGAKDLIHFNREPCPIAVFGDGTLLLSVNPKQADSCTKYCPTHPEILAFKQGTLNAIPERWIPEWSNNVVFSDHSYRALGVDNNNNEVILFQNIEYDRAEWSFRDRSGNWSKNGTLLWPVANYGGKETPLRLCYSNVAIKNRKVWFVSTNDIVEPEVSWREYKKELTGKQWDYVFRRLFYTYSENISEDGFKPWIEIANRDTTAGRVWHQDLWIDNDDRAHILWTEQAIDERLRERFFPNDIQYKALNYTVIHQGEIVKTTPVVSYTEGDPENLTPGEARFHTTLDGRLFVVYYIHGDSAMGEKLSENRITEILPEGDPGEFQSIPFEKPFTRFQTASERAGCLPSRWIDIIGVREDSSNTISYGQIRIS